jgi:hypothetical protein
MSGPGMEDPNKPKHQKAVVAPPRGKDMSWEQKCRISALRAACASAYDLRYMQAEGETPINSESDADVTERILARAETFRIALLGDGPLDSTREPAQRVEFKAVKTSVCANCFRAIERNDPIIKVTEDRWIDSFGWSTCGNLGVRRHDPDKAAFADKPNGD